MTPLRLLLPSLALILAASPARARPQDAGTTTDPLTDPAPSTTSATTSAPTASPPSASTVAHAATLLTFNIATPGGCLFQKADLLRAPSPDLAALWLRALFHDAGTFDAAAGTGGLDGSLQAEINEPVNAGLAKTLPQNFVDNDPTHLLALPISSADLTAMGAAVSVKHCGGPDIPLRLGRPDAPRGAENNFKLLPDDPHANLSTVLADFARMGLSKLDALTLVTGSHSMGGVHGKVTPKVTALDFVPFDETPGVFDNRIFQRSLRGQCVLDIDCAFKDDPDLLPYVKQFAEDQAAFFAQYVISAGKMMALTSATLPDATTTLDVPVHADLASEGGLDAVRAFYPGWDGSAFGFLPANTTPATTQVATTRPSSGGATRALPFAVVFLSFLFLYSLL